MLHAVLTLLHLTALGTKQGVLVELSDNPQLIYNVKCLAFCHELRPHGFCFELECQNRFERLQDIPE